MSEQNHDSRGNPYPDFYIIGAPKCGTTALYSYLRDHPEIFMPSEKEPRHFNTDLFGACGKMNGPIRERDPYFALFGDAPPGALKGEATATYLYSKVAVQRILEVNPSAKFIVSLRHPAEAMISFYHERRTSLSEDLPDIEQAWAAQSDRKMGKHIPELCIEPALLQYSAVFAYAEQLRRARESIPQNQLHLIIFEEFFANPAAGYASLLAFLGRSLDDRSHFPVVRPARKLRSEAFARFYLHPPAWLLKMWRPLRAPLSSIGVRPGPKLRQFNERRAAKAEIRPEFREELQAHFAPGIRDLETLLGRPITCWERRADTRQAQ